MKNTNRVRSKSGMKPASTQVKITAGTNENLSKSIDECPALVLFKSGSSIAQVFLTPAQFAQLEARVASLRKSNISLTDMLESALARMLIADDGFLELERAKNQALTLMELLSQTILGETSGFQRNEKFGGLLGAGLVDLVYAATVRLENAFNLADGAMHGHPKEVAS
jgi:hypothetical protein